MPKKKQSRLVEQCMFCKMPLGENGVSVSEEHILGESRLLRYNLSDAAIHVQHRDPFGNKLRPDWVVKGGAIRYVRKVVCKGCNNGWMSRLENSVDPLWDQIIHGADPQKFSSIERESLAWWGVKTSLVTDFVGVQGRSKQLPVSLADYVYKNFNQKKVPFPSRVSTAFSRWNGSGTTFAGTVGGELLSVSRLADPSLRPLTSTELGRFARFGAHYHGNCLITTWSPEHFAVGLVRNRHCHIFGDSANVGFHLHHYFGAAYLPPTPFNQCLSLISAERQVALNKLHTLETEWHWPHRYMDKGRFERESIMQYLRDK